MEQLYPSQSQPVCKATLCVARDRVKVQSRREYVFTDQIDQLIREIYLKRRDVKARPGSGEADRSTGFSPDWRGAGGIRRFIRWDANVRRDGPELWL